MKPIRSREVETAAGLAASLPCPQPPNEPLIVFSIPLVGRAQAQDWDADLTRLFATLASIDRQTYTNHVTYLCCQDQPPGFPYRDGQVFVPAAPFRPGVRGVDQAAKRRRIGGQIARNTSGFCYVMPLDADDILHPRLAAHVAGRNNGRGYLIDKGYLVCPGPQVAPLRPWGPYASFWEACGSCALVGVDFDRDPHAAAYLGLFDHAHKSFAAIAEAARRPLDMVDFPAMLYMSGHGGNVSISSGRAGRRNHYLRLFRMRKAAARRVLSEFGLPPA